MTVVNAGEVWYIVAREASVADADASIKQLRDLGIVFVDADWESVQEILVISNLEIRCHMQIASRLHSR